MRFSQPTNETELGMDKQEKSGVLVRDKEYVKFVQLLRKAEKEGRLDGTFLCGLCGMRFNTREDAEDCCRVSVS
jgi:hypothetical protein